MAISKRSRAKVSDTFNSMLLNYVISEDQREKKVREPRDKDPVHCWGTGCNGRVISGKNKDRHWGKKHKGEEKNMKKCLGSTMCSNCGEMLDTRFDGKQSIPTFLACGVL